MNTKHFFKKILKELTIICFSIIVTYFIVFYIKNNFIINDNKIILLYVSILSISYLVTRLFILFYDILKFLIMRNILINTLIKRQKTGRQNNKSFKINLKKMSLKNVSIQQIKYFLLLLSIFISSLLFLIFFYNGTHPISIDGLLEAIFLKEDILFIIYEKIPVSIMGIYYILSIIIIYLFLFKLYKRKSLTYIKDLIDLKKIERDFYFYNFTPDFSNSSTQIIQLIKDNELYLKKVFHLFQKSFIDLQDYNTYVSRWLEYVSTNLKSLKKDDKKINRIIDDCLQILKLYSDFDKSYKKNEFFKILMNIVNGNHFVSKEELKRIENKEFLILKKDINNMRLNSSTINKPKTLIERHFNIYFLIYSYIEILFIFLSIKLSLIFYNFIFNLVV